MSYSENKILPPKIGLIDTNSIRPLVEKVAENQLFILVDENTKLLCDSLFKKAPFLKNANLIEIKSGEENKNIETVLTIWKQLSDSNTTRNALLINLGGGVITDMGGFIASTYKRGIDFINIPTTLLAMVDASIGGKTGIDLDNFKNQVGVFSNPLAVFCDANFLTSLPKKELISGFAEVLKHGLVKDKNYWNYCVTNSFDELDWNKVITDSISIKLNIVESDPLEKGERKLLNFGHTVGHAIETHLMNIKTPILHGEAVAVGMICESYISSKTMGMTEIELEEITSSILTLFPKISLAPEDFEKLIALMQNDKKNDANGINFSLLKHIGKGTVNQTCDESLIKESLAFYTNL